MQRVVYRLFNNNMFYPNKLASLEEYGREARLNRSILLNFRDTNTFLYL